MIGLAAKTKNIERGVAVDIETRRKKQQALMVQLVERKVRSRAKQLYETRGQEEGQALQDWFQAESEVLGNSILAPLYRRLRTGSYDTQQDQSSQDRTSQNSGTGAKLTQLSQLRTFFGFFALIFVVRPCVFIVAL